MGRHVVPKYTPIILFIAACTTATDRNIESMDLSQPINDRSKSLLIILFNPEVKLKTTDVDFDNTLSEYSEDSSQDEETEQLTPKDDEAYFLYHILRTTENSQKIDSKTATTIKRTKEILQPILRSRCKKLEKCKRKCPKKNKSLCTKKCVVKIDVFIVCESKPKNNCKKSKCGKTMPPEWR